MNRKRIRGDGRMSADMGTDPSEALSIPDSILLPEEVLLQILSLVPAGDLIRRCSLVCTLWRDIINSPTLWKIKCHNMGYISKDCQRTPKDWKQFYYLSSKKRNLLKNHCGMDNFKFWKIEQNGGDEWKIEDLPGEHGQELPDKDVTKYFVTSYWPCKKSQLINLKKMGYGKKIMDLVQPDIVIRDWYAARADCGCQYEVFVQLLSERKEPIREYKPEPVTIQQWSDARWHQMTHTFSNYGPGVRYVYFQHGGQDTQFWAGWYGIRVTNSSITIEPEDLRA
ncbi:F-box only protein 44-like [Dendropsophus ebraccatus]|uniref:F-box only protein 44-like n=1 Tax=Dendropsophus ebraccatus TaxID=150705 RepID=UPI00383106A7